MTTQWHTVQKSKQRNIALSYPSQRWVEIALKGSILCARCSALYLTQKLN